MSYHAVGRYDALGLDLNLGNLVGGGGSTSGLWDKAKEIYNKAKPALQSAQNILEDPALPRVTQLVMELHQLEQKKTVAKPAAPAKPGVKPQPTKPAAAAPKVPGIGLQRVVKPLEAYAYARKNPWVVPVAVLGVLAIPFLLGRATAKRSRR